MTRVSQPIYFNQEQKWQIGFEALCEVASVARSPRVYVHRPVVGINNAIDRIAEQDAAAGRYLESTIKTGAYCKYVPM